MKLILVTGAPATGKTTVASHLADRLHIPLIGKDQIKEALDDALQPSSRDVEWTQRLGAAAVHTLWMVAGWYERLIIDCNLDPRPSDLASQIRQLDAQALEIFCHCSYKVARERYRRRVTCRHPVHIDTDLSADIFNRYDAPLQLGPMLVVNTMVPESPRSVSDWVIESWRQRDVV